MAVTSVHPVNVRDREVVLPPGIVLTGDPDTMWGDGSDSTYSYRAESYPVNRFMLGDVEPVTLEGITSVTAIMRVQPGPGSADGRVVFWMGPLGYDIPGDYGYSGVAGTGGSPRAPIGVITTLSDIVLYDNNTGEPMTAFRLQALFSGGFTVGVARQTDPPMPLTVYELAFNVTHDDLGGIPAQRVLQRRDGLAGSVPCAYPNPQSRQGGNRAFGGHL